jgi:hypothetical protein
VTINFISAAVLGDTIGYRVFLLPFLGFSMVAVPWIKKRGVNKDETKNKNHPGSEHPELLADQTANPDP